MPDEMIYEVCSFRGTEQHKVVAIEYHDGNPFSVMTERTHSANGKEYTSPTWWDFEWCKRDQTCYYDMSGSGGKLQFHVSPYVEPIPPKSQLWVASHIQIVKNSRQAGKIRSNANLLRMGTVRLAEPLTLKDRADRETQNPFDIASEGDCEYCKICDDWLPEDEMCCHVQWCDECGEWFYQQDRTPLSWGGSKCEHEEEE